MPGQTLLDVCAPRREFVRIVRERHPEDAQAGRRRQLPGRLGGDDARRRSNPDLTGPDRDQRRADVLLGAATTARTRCATPAACSAAPGSRSLASDLGAGKFDGAHLVENFENLNPANTLWDKYYHLFANIDTEPRRFLEFERWWGGFFLMNREEIEWIIENLFVGNKLRTATLNGPRAAPSTCARSNRRSSCSRRWATTSRRRSRRSTGSPTSIRRTEEIKARGQVIVGLMHENVGHLGIFVSGKVAKKEHAQIVDLIEYIEHLPPGLYGMQIEEQKTNGGVRYDVMLTERRVEDLQVLQKYGRKDEMPFEAVEATSEALASAYETFVHPARRGDGDTHRLRP